MKKENIRQISGTRRKSQKGDSGRTASFFPGFGVKSVPLVLGSVKAAETELVGAEGRRGELDSRNFRAKKEKISVPDSARGRTADGRRGGGPRGIFFGPRSVRRSIGRTAARGTPMRFQGCTAMNLHLRRLTLGARLLATFHEFRSISICDNGLVF